MRKFLIACVVMSSFLAVPDADAYIFWSSYDGGKSRVGRAGLDASGVNGALVTDIYYGAGVATDGEHVYWGESGDFSPRAGLIGRATVDGGEVNHAFQNAGNICGVFGIRATASDLYWLKSTCSGLGRAIDRAPKTGNQSYTEPGTGNGICGFDIDANYVYWSEGQYIARAPNTVPPQPADHTWINVGTGFAPCAVAVNGSHIYWTNMAPVEEFRGTSIGRAAIDGSPGSVEKEFIVGTTFFTEPSLPSGIDVDGNFVYWTNQPPVSSVTGTIGRANLDGTGVDYSFIDNVFDPISLDVDSGGPAPAPPATGPRPTRPPPPPMRIVAVNSSNSTFAPGGGSTGVRFARGLASAGKGKGVPRGTVFSYKLNQDANVKIEVKKVKAGRLVKRKCKKPKPSNAKKKKCDLLAHVPLRGKGKSGKNKVPYTGRVKGKALKPGKYKAFFTATGEGGNSKTASVAFKIVRP